MARVTVVNDTPEFLALVRDILEDDRYDTTTIDGDSRDVIRLIRESQPDLLMIDIRLGVEGDHGWQIAQRVRREDTFGSLPVLLCCSDPMALDELEAQFAEQQHVEVLPKPFSVDQLCDAVDRLLGERTGA